jgi:sulfatase maturation enzyme AslB (radical SAM superfamily)
MNKKHVKKADFYKFYREGFSNQKAVSSLMVMTTYACQLACKYCRVKLSCKKYITPEILEKAINFLFTTKNQSCLLRFWGGEPLLVWPLIEDGIIKSVQLSRSRKKKINFMITSNGIDLDSGKIDFLKRFNVEVMLSFDGTKVTNQKYRVDRKNYSHHEAIVKNIDSLISSNVAVFVNMVITQKTIDSIGQNLKYLKSLGLKKIQLGYENGVLWSRKNTELVFKNLKEFIKSDEDVDFIMNFSNDCEPTFLSQEVIVDVDGKIYLDGAIFLEKKFPHFRKSHFMGDVLSLKSIDSLFRTKQEVKVLCETGSSVSDKKVITNNIKTGLQWDEFFTTHNVISYEKPHIRNILRGRFDKQKEFLKNLDIESFYLYLNGSCSNNCIFCGHKTERLCDSFKLVQKIKDNKLYNNKKISLVGNEPLLHPEIHQLVEICKKEGFSDIEVMTSGVFLDNEKFLKKMLSAGVTAFSIPLFSSTELIHDTIVGRKGSFTRLRKAFDLLHKHKLNFYIHTNLLRQNIDSVCELERFVTQTLSSPFVILPVRPKNNGTPFNHLAPTYTEMIKTMEATNSLCGFPLCILKQIQGESKVSDYLISDAMKLYLCDQKFVKPKICYGCKDYYNCLGTFKEYLELYGNIEFKPRLNDRSVDPTSRCLKKSFFNWGSLNDSSVFMLEGDLVDRMTFVKLHSPGKILLRYGDIECNDMYYPFHFFDFFSIFNTYGRYLPYIDHLFVNDHGQFDKRVKQGRFYEDLIANFAAVTMEESDIVMGPDEKIKQVLKEFRIKKDALICLNCSCMSKVTGSDLKSIVLKNRFKSKPELIYDNNTGYQFKKNLVNIAREILEKIPPKKNRKINRIINLIGFEKTYSLSELVKILEVFFHIKTNTILLPEIDPKKLPHFYKSSLNVLHFQNQYVALAKEILPKNNIRNIYVSAPFGFSLTLSWLRPILDFFNISREEKKVFNIFLKNLLNELRVLNQQAQELKIGFIVSTSDLKNILWPQSHYLGLPLMSCLEELGFSMEILVNTKENIVIKNKFLKIFRNKAKHRVDFFENSDELNRWFSLSECRCVYSDFRHDKRLFFQGKIPFSSFIFEYGFSGILRTAMRLINLSEVNFFNTYRKYACDILRPVEISHSGRQIPYEY